ncbi:MAG: C40 family peptidase [Parasporobacterium sp.]|nr:C40 family peptidase [Parasporobacterium sp.]
MKKNQKKSAKGMAITTIVVVALVGISVCSLYSLANQKNKVENPAGTIAETEGAAAAVGKLVQAETVPEVYPEYDYEAYETYEEVYEAPAEIVSVDTEIVVVDSVIDFAAAEEEPAVVEEVFQEAAVVEEPVALAVLNTEPVFVEEYVEEVYEEPVPELVVYDVPVTELVVYEEPQVEEPVYEEPEEEPVYEEAPVIEESPVIEEAPAVEEQPEEEAVYEEISEEPVYEEVPVIEEEPVYEEPAYEEPVYEEPVYEEPVYEEVVEETPAEEVYVEELPVVEEVPAEPAEEEIPAIEETSAAEAPVEETPTAEAPAEEETAAPAQTVTTVTGEVSEVRQDLVDLAASRVGVTPYVWAGRSLETGTDCSGFVNLIYDNFGYYASAGSDDYQYNTGSWGTQISYDELLPGDVVVYYNGGHVGIYGGEDESGNDIVIHDSNEIDGVKVSDMFYSTPTAYVRILDDVEVENPVDYSNVYYEEEDTDEEIYTEEETSYETFEEETYFAGADEEDEDSESYTGDNVYEEITWDSWDEGDYSWGYDEDYGY